MMKFTIKPRINTNSLISCIAVSILMMGTACSREEPPKASLETEASVWDGRSIECPEGYSGLSTDTIDIRTASQLAWLAKETSEEGQTMEGLVFRLTSDIDLALHPWLPIGMSQKGFKGVFLGSNRCISGLMINEDNIPSAGLFGNISGEGSGVYDLDISGEIDVFFNDFEDHMVGALCGKAENTSISNITSNVIVKSSGEKHVPAVVGGVFGSAEDCHLDNIMCSSRISVNGGCSYLGGIAGNFISADKINSSNTLAYTGDKISLSNCEWTDVGGIVGYFFSRCKGSAEEEKLLSYSANTTFEISNSSNIKAGGLVGAFTGWENYSSELSNASFHGKLTASGSHDIDFGKLIGVLRLDVHNLEINNYKTEDKPKELIRQCFLTEGAILKVNGTPMDMGNGAPLRD